MISCGRAAAGLGQAWVEPLRGPAAIGSDWFESNPTASADPRVVPKFSEIELLPLGRGREALQRDAGETLARRCWSGLSATSAGISMSAEYGLRYPLGLDSRPVVGSDTLKSFASISPHIFGCILGVLSRKLKGRAAGLATLSLGMLPQSLSVFKSPNAVIGGWRGNGGWGATSKQLSIRRCPSARTNASAFARRTSASKQQLVVASSRTCGIMMSGGGKWEGQRWSGETCCGRRMKWKFMTALKEEITRSDSRVLHVQLYTPVTEAIWKLFHQIGCTEIAQVKSNRDYWRRQVCEPCRQKDGKAK